MKTSPTNDDQQAATDQRSGRLFVGTLSGIRRRLRDHELKPRRSGDDVHQQPDRAQPLKPSRANVDTSRNCLRSKDP